MDVQWMYKGCTGYLKIIVYGFGLIMEGSVDFVCIKPGINRLEKFNSKLWLYFANS